jgi:hypothetical protein
MDPYNGSREVHEVSQRGSVPDINVDNTPTKADSHYQAASDRPTYYYFAV